jgi:hypothetical protein
MRRHLEECTKAKMRKERGGMVRATTKDNGGAHRKALGGAFLHVLLDAGQVPRHLLTREYATPGAVAPAATAAPAASPTRRHAWLVVINGSGGCVEDRCSCCKDGRSGAEWEQLRCWRRGVLARSGVRGQKNGRLCSGAPEPRRVTVARPRLLTGVWGWGVGAKEARPCQGVSSLHWHPLREEVERVGALVAVQSSPAAHLSSTLHATRSETRQTRQLGIH